MNTEPNATVADSPVDSLVSNQYICMSSTKTAYAIKQEESTIHNR